MGCLPDCVAVLTLEADDDDLYNYTILTRVISERIGKTRLRRYIDDQDLEKGLGCIG